MQTWYHRNRNRIKAAYRVKRSHLPQRIETRGPRGKPCPRCNTDFWRHRVAPSGYWRGWECVECTKRWIANAWPQGPLGTPCSKCGTDNWATRVDKRPDHGGKRLVCRNCERLRRQAISAERKELYRQTQKAKYAANKELYRAKGRAYLEKNRVKALWAGARDRAKNLGLPFNLSVEDIVIPSTCPVLGIPLHFSAPGAQKNSEKDNSPSVDRLIPALGYVKGNVHVISWRANRIKNDGAPEEHALIAKWAAAKRLENDRI